MLKVKPKTFDEKLADIWTLCDRGEEQFHVSALPELGIQTLWVNGDSKEGYQHRGWELQRFPLFTIFVTAEEPP